MSTPPNPRFSEAVGLLDRGDLAGLAALLDSDPTLVLASSTSDEPPYDGYFHGATLLHHVAGNPIRGSMPPNVVEVARLLLDRGADPDAACGGGPTQPGTGGATTLGLVASGALAHREGHTEALIDLLLEHGARLDPEGGMFGTLYHVVEHRGQREVAHMLHARGVRADLPIAAGLGRVDLIDAFVAPGGRLTPGAAAIWSRTVRRGDALSRADILADALLAASANGWPDAVDRLLELGAPIDAVRGWGAFPVTALHCAAWAGWPKVIDTLLDGGADPHVREPTYGGTPFGWAEHSDRRAAMDAFRERGIRA